MAEKIQITAVGVLRNIRDEQAKMLSGKFNKEPTISVLTEFARWLCDATRNVIRPSNTGANKCGCGFEKSALYSGQILH